MSDNDKTYAEIAVDGPFRGGLTWRVPLELSRVVKVGSRVLVPFRNRAIAGLVLVLKKEPPEGIAEQRIRAISDLIHPSPIPAPLLKTCLWISKYYHAPIGEVVRLMLPSWSEGRASRLVRRAAGAERPDEPNLAAIFDALPADGPGITPEQLSKLVRKFRFIDLETLQGSGGVISSLIVDEKKRRPIIERTISLGPGGDERRLGPRQLQVMEFLREHRQALEDELRGLFKTSLATLRTLEARQLITIEEREIPRDPFARLSQEPAQELVLRDEQQTALDALSQAIDQGEFAPFLLHGVTGSGKTEVYLRAARRAIELGRRALILLPEIALTPQITMRFRAHLGQRTATLHSGLTDAERHDAWRRIQAGEIDVVVGARSALFAPLHNVGLIVVDEEHETSYKQEDGVRYNARDTALVLAKNHGAVIVLGSATPSLESWQNAKSGRYGMLRLSQRANQRPLPTVELIDRRTSPPTSEDPISEILTERLQRAVRDTVNEGNQAILFLNRRGFAPNYTCRSCGDALQCPSCDVALTWYRRAQHLRCHWCGYVTAPPSSCPSCSSDELRHIGFGTEQVEAMIAEHFSDLRVLRMDADSARGHRLFSLLDRFRRREADLLIGTQMLAKGHDFPNVALVGVLHADQALNYADFRSAERTFQLLSQVGGRAGRAQVTGRVLVQSWKPEHFVLQCAASHDEDRFREEELELRNRLGLPPFGYLIAIRMDSSDRRQLDLASDRVAGVLRQALGSRGSVTGPVDAIISRLRDRYRRQILLRSSNRGPLHAAVESLQLWLDKWKDRPSDVRMSIDVDPLSLF